MLNRDFSFLRVLLHDQFSDALVVAGFDTIVLGSVVVDPDEVTLGS